MWESLGGETGVSLLVCTWGAAFEMDLWSFGGVSADTLIIHTFLSAPACTDMVSSKELERDVTTNAMAKEPPRLKTLASFLHST